MTALNLRVACLVFPRDDRCRIRIHMGESTLRRLSSIPWNRHASAGVSEVLLRRAQSHRAVSKLESSTCALFLSQARVDHSRFSGAVSQQM
eukprot:5404067-Pleurochrysis_carterae.AAC.1